MRERRQSEDDDPVSRDPLPARHRATSPQQLQYATELTSFIMQP
jgi:hypothetical protein